MKKRQLHIHWEYDSHKCEECGTIYSKGATATLDGVIVFEEPPDAGCFSPVYVDLEDVLFAALEHLGVDVHEFEETDD